MKSNIIFKLSDLESLIADKESCVVCQQSCRNLQFLPSQTKNLKQSLKETLDSAIGSYDLKLNGITLNYQNIKIQPLTKLDDDGFVSITYKADIYIFSPKINSVLKGIVNKKSDDHIGVLVHKIFNVVIPCPANTSLSTWIGSQMNIGDEVVFKVVELNFNSPLPYIRGSFIDSDDRTKGILTDSGIEGSDQVDEVDLNFNPSKISKLIKSKDSSDEESNKDKDESPTQVSVFSKNIKSVSSFSKILFKNNAVILLDSKKLNQEKENTSESNEQNPLPFLSSNLEKQLNESNFTSDEEREVVDFSKITCRKQKPRVLVMDGKSPAQKSPSKRSRKHSVDEITSSSPDEKVLRSKSSNLMSSEINKHTLIQSKGNPSSPEDQNFSKNTIHKEEYRLSSIASLLKNLEDNSNSSESTFSDHESMLQNLISKENTEIKDNTLHQSKGISSSFTDNEDKFENLSLKCPKKKKITLLNQPEIKGNLILKDNPEPKEFIKIKPHTKNSASILKPHIANSSTSEDENISSCLIMERRPKKRDIDLTSHLNQNVKLKSCPENVNIEGGKLLKNTKYLKANASHNQAKKDNSSSSDEDIVHEKLSKKRKFLNANMSSHKQPAGYLSSSHDDYVDIKLSKKSKFSKASATPHEQAVGSSSSSEDDNLFTRILKEIKCVKPNSPYKLLEEDSSLNDGIIDNKLSKKTKFVKSTTTHKNPEGQSSSSSEEDIVDKKLTTNIKSAKASKTQHKLPDEDSSSSDEGILDNKLSKKTKFITTITTYTKPEGKASSSSSEDDSFETKLLKEIKSVKANTSPHKQPNVDYGFSTKDNIVDKKLFKKAESVKANIIPPKQPDGNSSSSSEDESLETKLLKKTKSIKPNPRLEQGRSYSFSSEDEGVLRNKLPKIETQLKHNNISLKQNKGTLYSLNENELKNKFPKKNTCIEFKTKLKKQPGENFSNSKDEKQQVKINSQIKEENGTSTQSEGILNASFLDDNFENKSKKVKNNVVLYKDYNEVKSDLSKMKNQEISRTLQEESMSPASVNQLSVLKTDKKKHEKHHSSKKKHKKIVINDEKEKIENDLDPLKKRATFLNQLDFKHTKSKKFKNVLSGNFNTVSSNDPSLRLDKVNTNIEENSIKCKKKKLDNIKDSVEKEDSLNKGTEVKNDLIFTLLAETAHDMDKKSPHVKISRKKGRKLEKKKKYENLDTGEITSLLLKDAFKSINSKSKVEKRSKFNEKITTVKQTGNFSLDTNTVENSVNKKKRKTPKGNWNTLNVENITEVQTKKKKHKKDNTLDEMTSALLSQALSKVNNTEVKTDVRNLISSTSKKVKLSKSSKKPTLTCDTETVSKKLKSDNLIPLPEKTTKKSKKK